MPPVRAGRTGIRSGHDLRVRRHTGRVALRATPDIGPGAGSRVTGIAFRFSPSWLAAGLAAPAITACALLLAGPITKLSVSPVSPGAYDVTRMVLVYATLPRLFMAILCGAALSTAGAILQQALGNPLASPT